MKIYPKKGTFIQKLQIKQHNLCSILLFLGYLMNDTDFTNVFVKMSILYCFKETYLLLHGLITNIFFSKLSNVEHTKLNRFFQLCIAHIAWVSYELPSGVVFSNWKRWTELHKSHRGKTIIVSVFLQCDLQL